MTASSTPSVLKGLIALVIAGIIISVAIASCGGSHTSSGPSSRPYSAPTSFTVSNDAVAQVVHDAIAGDSYATRMNGSPVVDCTGETTCTIAYTVQEPTGGSTDLELIEPTRQIWKALFTDAQFERGTITVSGPTTSVGGIKETSMLFTLTCDRNAASQIDWDNVDGNGIKTLCKYLPEVKGL